MSDVRNQRLAVVATSSAAGVIAFSVPVGTVVLLKAIEITNVAATAGDAYALIQGGGLAVYTPWVNLQPNRGVHQDLWVAMNPGDNIVVASSVWPMRFWLSGAVLAGGPPYPVMPQLGTVPTLPIVVAEAPAAASATRSHKRRANR